MDDKEAAIAAIRTCKTRESLDGMLSRFEITDTQETLDILNASMYNPQTFFSLSGEITLEDKLEFTKQMFLTGGWRLNELYEKMGIANA